MEHYAGIDVSLDRSSVCVIDATGRIVREAKVPSEPDVKAERSLLRSAEVKFPGWRFGRSARISDWQLRSWAAGRAALAAAEGRWRRGRGCARG